MKIVKFICIVASIISLLFIILGTLLQLFKSNLPIDSQSTLRILGYKRIGSKLQSIGIVFLILIIIVSILILIFNIFIPQRFKWGTDHITGLSVIIQTNGIEETYEINDIVKIKELFLLLDDVKVKRIKSSVNHSPAYERDKYIRLFFRFEYGVQEVSIGYDNTIYFFTTNYYSCDTEQSKEITNSILNLT